jgi:hypothetical protein
MLDLPDPPTARTQALRASMREHESTARGSRQALLWVIGATVICAIGFVIVLLMRRG